MKKGFLKTISFLLLFVIVSGILKTVFNSYIHESHEYSYLEFAHVHMHNHTENHDDCHGSMVNGLAYIPVSFNHFADLILKFEIEYTAPKNSIYKNPDSSPLRKPPRFS